MNIKQFNDWLSSDKKQSLIMGILNVTPDSFSDGGQYFDKNVAVEHALAMIRNGANIIDIGGESTRPFSDPVCLDEEIFLGREIQSHRVYSEETAQMIDHEVVSIIKNAQDTARRIHEKKIDLLHLMAEELLEHETIDESDIKVMLSGKKISKK